MASQSRYELLTKQPHVSEHGREFAYYSRRFIPKLPNDKSAYRVIENTTTRLDLLTFEQLKDVNLFWKICDLNTKLSPFDYCEFIGEKINVPRSPYGV